MNREILKLAIPNILTNLSVPLVSIVDLALMGRMPSSHYIIAIGFGTVIFNFLYWAFGFLRMGTTGMVSQAFGKQNQAETIQLLLKGLIISLIAGIVLLIFQKGIAHLSILIIDPDDIIIAPLNLYFKYRIYAAPATISIYVISGWLMGMQDSKSAMVIAIAINGINTLLSYLLVYSFNLDIAGVALGTVIAQYAGILISIIILFKKYKLNLFRLNWKSAFTSSGWKEFILVNGNIFVRTICLIFVLSFFKTQAGNVDPILGAANILLLEFVTISAFGIDGFAYAAESLSGKYFGQNNKALFFRAIKVLFKWGIGFSILISLVFHLSGKQILTILTDKNEIIDTALIYLPWLVLAPIINSIAFIWDGIYIGTTASKAMRDTLLISSFIVFLPSYYYFVNSWGNHGIWLSLSLFMLSRGLIQTFLAPRVIFNRIG